ncbi:MAG: D-alanyl-D-alanine carboxypeptidase family protein [Erysipelotrichaceae bacterium]|nr:D-alanyl-D-alanine carboxypeptidase family protein [Erysipelotrichaceae bacterium]
MSEADKTVKKKNMQKKRKPRRRVRWWLLILPVVIVIALIAAFRIPKALSDSKVRQLGYTQQEADAIREMGLIDLILENGYYSRHLADEILAGTLKRNYIPLYLATDPGTEFTDRDFLLYSRLLDAGYEEDQLTNLFGSLRFREIVPLLVLDYQWNEQIYIDDVIACRENNAGGTFVLENSYHQFYRMKYPAENPAAVDVLVNKNYYLPGNYSPSDLTEVTTEYAVDGMRLRKEAANAALKMCREALDEGYAFFISGSYQDYVSIKKLYEYYLSNRGELFADLEVGKEGFSEFQTGLSASFAATYEKYEDFSETECYQWLSENAQKYGFIERYPEGMEDITLCAADPSYFRYVGKELAPKVKASSLTYDEYWCLLLKGWENESNKPADSMIENAEKEITE